MDKSAETQGGEILTYSEDLTIIIENYINNAFVREEDIMNIFKMYL